MALRIEGYIWNLSVNPVHVALELTGEDSRGNAWAATGDLGRLLPRRDHCNHEPEAKHPTSGIANLANLCKADAEKNAGVLPGIPFEEKAVGIDPAFACDVCGREPGSGGLYRVQICEATRQRIAERIVHRCFRREVRFSLPAAVKKVDRITLHPGMPIVASVLTVMGDS